MNSNLLLQTPQTSFRKTWLCTDRDSQKEDKENAQNKKHHTRSETCCMDNQNNYKKQLQSMGFVRKLPLAVERSLSSGRHSYSEHWSTVGLFFVQGLAGFSIYCCNVPLFCLQGMRVDANVAYGCDGLPQVHAGDDLKSAPRRTHSTQDDLGLPNSNRSFLASKGLP
eukprot:31333-Amphidinium_carterae.2